MALRAAGALRRCGALARQTNVFRSPLHRAHCPKYDVAHNIRCMTTIALRIDSELEALLVDLMSDGRDRLTVIREAVRLAWSERRQQALLAESAAISSDPGERAEADAIQRDMADLRAW